MGMVAFFVVATIGFVSFFIYKAYKNTRDVVVQHVEVKVDEPSPAMSSLKILHISDLHLENISVTPDELRKKLEGERIDLIALTGDFLDRKRTIPKLRPYLKVLREQRATYGMYAVFGNHDYVLQACDFDRLEETLQACGCKTLRNEHETIEVDGQWLNVIGVDDYSTRRSDISASYAGVKHQDGINLVLTHDPNVVLEMKDVAYDYLLAGHFHGGQIHWPKPYHLVKMGKLVRMNMVKGLHKYAGKQFYISEGLGQTGVNIRVGSRPEITFHHLQFAKKAKSEKSAV